MAVTKDGVVFRNLPRKISHVCSLFLRRGGTIHCRATGGQRYSHDLPQGGLEIPCWIVFGAKQEQLKKLKRSLKS